MVDNDTAERDNGYFGGATADVYNHTADRLVDGQTGPNRGGHRFFDHVGFAGPGVKPGLAGGAFFYLGYTAGDAYDNPGVRPDNGLGMHLADKFLEHFLGDVKVRNYAVAQRTDRHDVRRGFPCHGLGIRPDSFDIFGPAVYCDVARLTDYDAFSAHVDQCVSRTQVNTKIAAEYSEQ